MSIDSAVYPEQLAAAHEALEAFCKSHGYFDPIDRYLLAGVVLSIVARGATTKNDILERLEETEAVDKRKAH